jgi:two-component system chemotaxis response regulator CheY
MFTPKEITFLKTELNGYIDKAQQWLDKEDIDPARREQIESRLITTVSIVNKLEHTKAEDEEKSQLVRVLIVDDTESMRGIVKHFFSECGFKQIDVAEDGVRALSMMKRAYQEKDPYKLVISDWEMPNMTGLELLWCHGLYGETREPKNY